jgi:hypothetical protein
LNKVKKINEDFSDNSNKTNSSQRLIKKSSQTLITPSVILNLDSSKLLNESKPLIKTPETPDLNPRNNKIIKEILIDEEEAELSIYDYGTVDGDIVTLIDNEKILFEKLLLTQQPVKCKINNRVTNIHILEFYAENLGKIAPNTGSLIIKTRTKRIEINFSSDFANTSSIKLIFKTK